VFLATLVVMGRAFAQTANQTPGKPSAGTEVTKLYGDASLMTDLMEYGMTQTEHSMAIKAGFGYQWSQFRLGVSGYNVKFPKSEDSINVRLQASYKFLISANTDLNVGYILNNYSKEGSRNGNIISVDLQMFTYHVKYSSQENFEASGATNVRYGFGKEWAFLWGTTLEAGLGYNDVVDSGFSNFFDAEGHWRIRWQEITWAMSLGTNSKAAEYPGRSGLLFILSASVAF